MTLPIWFLVLSLVLPRISLIAIAISGGFPHLMSLWLSVPLAALLPRILILIGIATVMGLCPWFWIHFAVMCFVWLVSAIHGIAQAANQKS